MRVVVIGDDGVGKSSLITRIFKDQFVNNIEDQLVPMTVEIKDHEPITVVDTSASLERRQNLLSELKRANAIWLIYSDDYTFERISLFWIPFLRSSGVNLPLTLTQNKQDEVFDLDLETDFEDDRHIIELMQNFKEIEGFIKSSALRGCNVHEALAMCYNTVKYPLAPLFDSKLGTLKPELVSALNRIFHFLDTDLTNILTNDKLQALQLQVFNTLMDDDELKSIELKINAVENSEKLITPAGLTKLGFFELIKEYILSGNQRLVWTILRHYHYTDSLSLDDKFFKPKFQLNPLSKLELSPNGYQFLVDLFTLFDLDNDGGLSESELEHLFTPTYGVPKLWLQTNFPYSTLRNENGYITLQGWLAQWSMYVHLSFEDAVECLGMLGYANRTSNTDLKSCLRTTKPQKKRNRKSQLYLNSSITDRQVFYCVVLGQRGSGISTLLTSFLHHTKQNQPPELYKAESGNGYFAVNTVEISGGKQCHLILHELSTTDNYIEFLQRCDVVCLAFDSSDPTSFGHLVEFREQNAIILDDVPLVFAALKADLDRVQQRSLWQPDEYCSMLNIASPMHVSSQWSASLNELFVQLVESAMYPGKATVHLKEDELKPKLSLEFTALAGVMVSLGVAWWWWARTK